MDFLIPLLFAAPPEGGGVAGIFASLLPVVAMIAILWFLLFRPQQKEQQRHREMIRALRKGDEVVTAGGLYGRIMALSEERISLKIADGVKVDVERAKVLRVLEKGADEEAA
ncbi:MAG TPA: preprotein translocase subunit YajC [Gemmatimonadota bacterium]|jgi:preprotein translocase subunit YajC|nr:preprotein translocase subunit YajC [Gemmatimonadota bacterium]